MWIEFVVGYWAMDQRQSISDDASTIVLIDAGLQAFIF